MVEEVTLEGGPADGHRVRFDWLRDYGIQPMAFTIAWPLQDPPEGDQQVLSYQRVDPTKSVFVFQP